MDKEVQKAVDAAKARWDNQIRDFDEAIDEDRIVLLAILENIGLHREEVAKACERLAARLRARVFIMNHRDGR